MSFRTLLSTIFVVSLVFGLVSSVGANTGLTPASALEAGQKLAALGLIQGRTTSELALNHTITRAEFVTLLVRALGRDKDSVLLAGAPAFPDTANHSWASGYIALAKDLGIVAGYSDGTFRPEENVTVPEAVAFLVKFLGLKVNEQLGWPNSFLSAALTAGIISPADNALTTANTPAMRWVVFYLADKAFSQVTLPSSGRSVYQTYVDSEPPELTVEVDVYETTATILVISGRVIGHSALQVGTSPSEMKSVRAVANGVFTAPVSLEIGENTIYVHAADLAGNEITRTFTVSRIVGAPALIDVTPTLTVSAGSETVVNLAVQDLNGQSLSGVVVDGISDVGTFADGKFTASTKPGSGTLTLRSGNAVATVGVTVTVGPLAKVEANTLSVAPGQPVTLTAVDEWGNVVPGAMFRLDSDLGVVGPNGMFMGSKVGNYTITAEAGGATAAVRIGVHDSTVHRYILTPAAEDIIANGSGTVEVTIEAVDRNGNRVSDAENEVVWDALSSSTFQGRNARDSDWDSGSIPNTPLSRGIATVRLRSRDGVTGGRLGLLKVRDSVDSSLTGDRHLALTEQRATSLRIRFDDTHLPNNNGTENIGAHVEVLDQLGAPMGIGTGAWHVTVQVSGPAELVDDHTDANPASAKAGSIVGDTPFTTYLRSVRFDSGTIAVTASHDLLGTATGTVISTSVGLPAKLHIEASATSGVANEVSTIEYTVRITDSDGLPVQAAPSTVWFRLGVATGGDVTELKAAQYHEDDDGTYTVFDHLPATGEFQLNFLPHGTASVRVRSGMYTGTIQATVADMVTTGTLSSASTSVTLVADRPEYVKMTKGAVAILAISPSFPISAQLFDAAGNRAEGVKKLRFSTPDADVKINGNSTTEVLTDATGNATVDVTVPGYVGEAFTIVVDGSPGSGVQNYGDATSEVVISPVNAVPANMTAQIRAGTPPYSLLSAIDAGAIISLVASVRDQNGRLLPGVDTALLKVKVAEGKVDEAYGTDGFTVWVDNGDGTYVTTFRGVKDGRLLLEVSSDASPTEVKAQVVISVRAGPYAGVRVMRHDYSSVGVGVTKDKPTQIRLVPVDSFGNIAPYTTTDVSITISADTNDYSASGDYFEIRSTADGHNLLSGTGATAVMLRQGSSGVSLFVHTQVNVKVDFVPDHGDGDLNVTFFAGS